MEDVTVQEILDGIHNPAFASQRLPLLELLTNKLAEPLSVCSTVALAQRQTDGETATETHTDTQTETETESQTVSENATVASAMGAAELDSLYKTLLSIVEKTSCKTLQGRRVVHVALCALCNSTTTEAQVQLFLELTGSISSMGAPEQVQSAENQICNRQFHHMIKKYLEYNPQLEDRSVEGDDWINSDEWQSCGNVLTNLSQVEDGRRVLMNKTLGYMELLPIQIRSNNPTRRRGAVGCIRSCLFNRDIHWWMLYDIKILTPILLPLVVPTPFTEKEREGMDPVLWMQAENPDKTLEPEHDILTMLLDCVVLLCQRRGLREELRKRRAYYVFKNLDLKVDDDKVSEKIYEIVNFLVGDEDPTVPIDTYQDTPDVLA